MKNFIQNKITLPASIFLLVLIGLNTPLAFASGGRSGSQEIREIYQRSGDGHIQILGKSGDWDNPDACQDSSRIVIDGGNAFRKDLHTTALSLQMSGRPIEAYLSGCILWDAIEYPIVWGIFSR